MAISRQKKEEIVKEIKEILSRNRIVFLIDYTGTKTAKLNQFRSALKKLGAKYQVIKKSLAEIAFADARFDFSPFSSHAGSLALIAANEGESEMAKLIADFQKENENVTAVGGYLEKIFLAKEKISFLAKIPSREILLGQVAGALSAPMRNLVLVLSASIRKLPQVLNAIERSKPQRETQNL